MSQKPIALIARLIFFCLCAFWAQDCSASERYFIIVFGSQSSPLRPDHTHTCATAVKTTHQFQSGRLTAVEYHTISWLPSTLQVHVFRLWNEPGTNFDLRTTICAVTSTRQHIGYWGQNRNVSDCIHAVSDIDYSHRRAYYLELKRLGELAAEFFVFSLAQRGRINPHVTHNWVADSIGLYRYPVQQRVYRPLPWWF